MSTLNLPSIEVKPQQPTTDLAKLKKGYLKTLDAPLDGYWENAVIGLAPHHEIWDNKDLIGYYVLTQEKQLLQLYTTTIATTVTALDYLLSDNQVETAVVGTNDPFILAACLRKTDHLELSVNTYLFQDSRTPELLPPIPTATFRLARMDDLDSAINFYNQNNEYEDSDAIDDGFGGHVQYTKSLIENKQLFLFTNEMTIFGIGECRFSQTQPPFADVGMIVNKQHRRQNIGTTILIHLKQYCYENGRKPICSCDATNFASRKTIEKAGFYNSDRLLNIKM